MGSAVRRTSVAREVLARLLDFCTSDDFEVDLKITGIGKFLAHSIFLSQRIKLSEMFLYSVG